MAGHLRRPPRSAGPRSRTTLPCEPATGGVIRDGFDAALDEARELTRGGQRLIVELEARLRESVRHPQPQAPLHARLRLVHRGHAHAPRQGSARLATQADDRHRASASPATSSTSSPTSSPTPRTAPAPARPSSSRASCAISRAPRRAASRRRGPPGGVGRRERARRGRAPRRLGAPGDRRLARAGPRRRPTPCRREACRRRPIRAERRSTRRSGTASRACGSSPGPNMAGKSTLMRQTALCRDPRADGRIRARPKGAHRRASTACSPVSEPATTCRVAKARSWSR